MRAGLEAFAAKRRTDQDDLEKQLYPLVAEAVKAFPAVDWYNDLLREVARSYVDVFHREGGKGEPSPSAADFTASVRATLDKTKDPDVNTVDRVSTWLATAILNAGTQAAAATDEEFLVMEWVTMHDSDVRPAHADTDGQTRPPGEPFDVDGVAMAYPGDPAAPIELWINCRCSLAPTHAADAHAMRVQPTELAASDEPKEAEMADEEGPMLTQVPWHGVLAPEGSWSGDGRMFNPGSLRFRDLPLPLTWQKAAGMGHDGSVVVAKIEAIARVEDQMRGTGTFMMTPEADEAIGLVAEFGRFGVSVDADDAEFEYNDDGGKVAFTSARIASASMVAIPAFAEAYLMLGDAPDGFMPSDGTSKQPCDPNDPDCNDEEDLVAAIAALDLGLNAFVSDKPWSNFTQADYSDQQWKSACVLHLDSSTNKNSHKLPIKEPGGALNRNGVHAAAARFNQVQAPPEAKSAAKSRLRSAYSQIGEDPPDVLKASAFGRGPGWLTDPVATKRIHDYWTVPGEEGYAKINWGVPGDFNRCKVEIGQEIAEQDPATVALYMNQICAQWHHDATGFWPGHAPAEVALQPTGDAAPALSLVAGGGFCAPSEWFVDPGFAEGDGRMVRDMSGNWACPLTVTEEGRVFGHLAGWKTCHTAYKMCVAPPRSASGYAYFLTGAVLTDAGPVPTGPITYGTGHARPGGMRAALAHYDNTGTAVADVACGEDEYGIWLAGWVRPGVAEEQVVGLRASAPSGDWRAVGGDPENMELIAALSVNTPGFPVPRVGIENGVQVSLVAAGVVNPSYDEPDLRDQVKKMVVEEIAQIGARRARMAELSARIGG